MKNYRLIRQTLISFAVEFRFVNWISPYTHNSNSPMGFAIPRSVRRSFNSLIWTNWSTNPRISIELLIPRLKTAVARYQSIFRGPDESHVSLSRLSITRWISRRMSLSFFLFSFFSLPASVIQRLIEGWFESFVRSIATPRNNGRRSISREVGGSHLTKKRIILTSTCANSLLERILPFIRILPLSSSFLFFFFSSSKEFIFGSLCYFCPWKINECFGMIKLRFIKEIIFVHFCLKHWKFRSQSICNIVKFFFNIETMKGFP